MEGVSDIYELSPMQHGMLYDSVTIGDSGMYLMQLEYFLAGPLDVEALREAWQRTFDRHAILRTSFHWDELAKPLQVVHDEQQVELPLTDLSSLDEDAQTQRLARHRAEDRAQGVSFDEAPLTRLALFRTGSESWRLVWSLHHILMEGWSASMVLGEVLQHYRGLVAGEAPVLSEHRPYRDYVTWIQEQDPQAAEDWWRAELAGFEVPTHMGIDQSPTRMHAPVTEYDGRQIRLSAETSATLSEFAQRRGITLNTLVQGAWSVLLSRYSGESDVVFGTIVSGRSIPLEGVESMVGLFVNLLPSRVQLPVDQAVGDWLSDLQARQVKQRSFEYSSLVTVKGYSDVPAGLPLFESLLVFENWLGDLTVSDWGGGLRVEDVHGHHGGPGYPLTVIITPGPELNLAISYDSTRFDAESVMRLLHNFERVLLSIASAPETPLARVPVVSQTERHTLLVDWNKTAAGSPGDAESEPVHVQFARQAQATPDAIAVLQEGAEALTYRELASRAMKLAHLLREEGLGEGARVGLCVEREPLMVVALLGILSAGASYVPLDPMYPEERLRFLLEDAQVDLLLTQERLLDRFPTESTPSPVLCPVLCLDSLAERLAAQADTPLADGSAGPDALAYMIYTSGSTGRPKGVLIPHRALSNYVSHAREAFGLTSADRVLQFASVSFDTAAEEIYPALLAGATLVLRTDAMIGSVATFLRACTEQDITVIDFPTAYWHVVMSGLADSGVPFPATVRVAILGGERAKPEQLAEWFEQVGSGPLLLNTYGPTEATIVGTAHSLMAGDYDVPIGRPVRNVRAYVLDPNGEPLPMGVPGELHLAGAGVADGYFERPELTAERFLPDPFLEELRQGGALGAELAGSPTRMYRTGDVVRHREDGALLFLGRRDNQVKFRGYRIELEEIEAALAQYDGVEEAAVLLREDSPGNPRLVAYVVISSGGPDTGALREALSDSLPSYMVPSAWMTLDAFPLNTQGKVDRDRLPAPDAGAAPARSSGFVAPVTPMETRLAAIWADVLELECVGLHDNFFDLGGHSLLLMQVIGEIEKQLDLKMNPGELVLPTLGQLATLCELRAVQGAADKPKKGLMKRLARVFRGGSQGPSSEGPST